MAKNRGKQFEQVVRKAFENTPNVSIDRLHDQTNGFAGSQNICDLIVYRKPHEYYFECKSVHGNILPFTNITDTQWKGLLQKSQIKGVYAGILCWWVDKDITRFIPIKTLQIMKEIEMKSVRYDFENDYIITVPGKKKRVFFEYDMEVLLDEISSQ